MLTGGLAVMFTNVGIKSTSRRLLLTFANAIVSWAGALAGSYTNDAIGRRTKLWIGSIVLSCLLAIVTGISAMAAKATQGPGPHHFSSVASNAGIAFVSYFLPFPCQIDGE